MFRRMRTYVVFTAPAGEDVQLVEERFAIFAFLFGAFWALYHRAWLVALGLFVINGVGMMLVQEALLTQAGYAAMQIIVSLYVGVVASDIRCRALVARGYTAADVVIADSRIKALQRYFDGSVAVR